MCILNSLKKVVDRVHYVHTIRTISFFALSTHLVYTYQVFGLIHRCGIFYIHISIIPMLYGALKVKLIFFGFLLLFKKCRWQQYQITSNVNTYAFINIVIFKPTQMICQI